MKKYRYKGKEISKRRVNAMLVGSALLLVGVVAGIWAFACGFVGILSAL